MDGIELKYGRNSIKLPLDIFNNYEILLNEKKSDKSVREIVCDALQNPIDSLHLREIVKAGEKVCIVISDISRAYQRQDLFLPIIINELNNAGIPDADITLICANGAHDMQSAEEKKYILGDQLSKRFKVIEHNCFNEAELIKVGVTSKGTVAKINKKALECDRLILTGAIVLHDMAGYGGGRKSLTPGLASYETVAANHAKVFSSEKGAGLDPACRLANIDGNPMHEEMMEICDMVKPDFIFNVILDSNGEFYKAVAGNYKNAFIQGTKYCDEASVVYIPDKGDVAIAGCGGYPKDMNLYQASKGYSAGVEAVKKGGTVIVVAYCEDNMGSEESSRIILDYNNNEERRELMKSNFIPEAYSGYLLCELAADYNLILVSEYEDEEELKKCGIKLFRSVEEAVKSLNLSGEEKAYILPNSYAVLPKVK